MSVNSESESETEHEELVLGRVYKLTNSLDDMYYYGSTHNTLEERLKQHISFANNGKKLSKMQQHFNKIGWENVSIELVLEVPIKYDWELRIYESKYICEHLLYIGCLNSKLSYYYRHHKISRKEFLETPTEKIIQMERDYSARVYKEMRERAEKRNAKLALKSGDPDYAKKCEIERQIYFEKVNIDCATLLRIEKEKENEKARKKAERENEKLEKERAKAEKERLRLEKEEKIRVEKEEKEKKMLEIAKNEQKKAEEPKKMSILEIIKNCAANNTD